MRDYKMSLVGCVALIGILWSMLPTSFAYGEDLSFDRLVAGKYGYTTSNRVVVGVNTSALFHTECQISLEWVSSNSLVIAVQSLVIHALPEPPDGEPPTKFQDEWKALTNKTLRYDCINNSTLKLVPSGLPKLDAFGSVLRRSLSIPLPKTLVIDKVWTNPGTEGDGFLEEVYRVVTMGSVATVSGRSPETDQATSFAVGDVDIRIDMVSNIVSRITRVQTAGSTNVGDMVVLNAIEYKSCK